MILVGETAYPSQAPEFNLIFRGVRVAQFLCVVLLCVFTFLVPFWDVRFEIRIKAMLGSLYLLSFLGGLMSYLRYVCYLLIGTSNTCCVVVTQKMSNTNPTKDRGELRCLRRISSVLVLMLLFVI
jgi:hypothetical protein